jgi:hypothetical protein
MLTIVDSAGVPVQNVIMPWGITQRYNVYGQLMMGIRQGCPACIIPTRASPDKCHHRKAISIGWTLLAACRANAQLLSVY